MKSDKENNLGLFERVKQRVALTLAKVHSPKLPLPRLSVFSKSRTKILREKYCHTRSKTKSRRQRNTAQRNTAQRNTAKKSFFAAIKNLTLRIRISLHEFLKSCIQLIKSLKPEKFPLNKNCISAAIKNLTDRIRLREFLKSCIQLIKNLKPEKFPLSKDSISAAIKNLTLRIRIRLHEFLKSCIQLVKSLTDRIRLREFLKSCIQLIKSLKPKKFPLNKNSFIESIKKLPHRLHLPSLFKFCGQLIAKWKLPKFSLSQLTLPGNFEKYLNAKVIAAVTILFLGGYLIHANSKVNAFAVEIDGKRVAVTTEKAAAENFVSNIKAEKARIWNRNVDLKQTLVFKDTKAKRFQIGTLTGLKVILKKNLTFVAVATGIKVNGQIAVVVKDPQTAENVLQQLKNSYSMADLKVNSIAFQETVELTGVPVSLGDVVPADEALKVLKEGKQKKVIHVVKEGDSLWSIARDFSLNVADLQKANPSIKNDRLSLNQEINLVALEPIISVVITGERTVKEPLPYKVVVETNRSLWHGREQVKTKGKNGQREATYKLVLKNGAVVSKATLQEKVLQAAVNQVVIRGTKYVIASRGGTGKLGWPIGGRITSNFGKRRGGRHTGIDINGNRGDPVGAAASGVVISTGWDGGYGRTVMIRHDDNLVTRYAHLSKIEVSVGQKVERGDLIGLVGSTGHSTGSHLHFEVISGGTVQNPLKYLK